MKPLPTFGTPRSKLTVIEGLEFPIRRVYFLHSFDPAVTRAGHAHRKLHRLMVAVAGSVRATLDGELVVLNRPEMALELPPMTWLEIAEVSKDAVLLMIASEGHDENDCIRDRAEYLELRRQAGLE